MMGRWWKIMETQGIGELLVVDRRWAQTGEGALLSYRAARPRTRYSRPVCAVPEDQIVSEKA